MQYFFIAGMPRCGTSLLVRCISDHSHALCLWESHVNRIISVNKNYHRKNMKNHRLSDQEVSALDVYLGTNPNSIFNWYSRCIPMLQEKYHKDKILAFGDKDPHWCVNEKMMKAIYKYPKIFIVRDPRAVYCSGEFHWKNKDKGQAALTNFLAVYRRAVDYFPRSLVIRYEDLVLKPTKVMRKVYSYIGLQYDDSFLNRKAQPGDKRFFWHKDTTSEMNHGNLDKWKNLLPTKTVNGILGTPNVQDIMKKFCYDV